MIYEVTISYRVNAADDEDARIDAENKLAVIDPYDKRKGKVVKLRRIKTNEDDS